MTYIRPLPIKLQGTYVELPQAYAFINDLKDALQKLCDDIDTNHAQWMEDAQGLADKHVL